MQFKTSVDGCDSTYVDFENCQKHLAGWALEVTDMHIMITSCFS